MLIPEQINISETYNGGLVWQYNAFHSINEVTVHQAKLVLRWVTACGQINYLGM